MPKIKDVLILPSGENKCHYILQCPLVLCSYKIFAWDFNILENQAHHDLLLTPSGSAPRAEWIAPNGEDTVDDYQWFAIDSIRFNGARYIITKLILYYEKG